MTINDLLDEVLLDIFDFYRQGVDSYDQWREKYVWFNLTHVCRRWRAVIFASSLRLDLGITVGPIKPKEIETILAGPLPILIEYKCMYEEMTSSAIWRLRAALKHHDRVRGIFFGGTSVWSNEFFRATNHSFPILERLTLVPLYGVELKLPETFLGGQDVSDSHLRHLKLLRVSLRSIFRFLSSTSTLTGLHLEVDTAFGISPETSLLACLQGMPCLSRLDLSIFLESPSSVLTPGHNDIVPLSKLICFHYTGHSVSLDGLAAGLSAPSLRELSMEFFDAIVFPIVHLTRFITETEEHYHAVCVSFNARRFRLSLFARPEYVTHRWPPLKRSRTQRWSPESIMRMSDYLLTKLLTVEELCVNFALAEMDAEDCILWRRFYQQFPSVKVLRTESANYACIAFTLLRDREEPDDVLALFPALEEIELGNSGFWVHQTGRESELAVFQPFVSARQQAGRPVKVFFDPWLDLPGKHTRPKLWSIHWNTKLLADLAPVRNV